MNRGRSDFGTVKVLQYAQRNGRSSYDRRLGPVGNRLDRSLNEQNYASMMRQANRMSRIFQTALVFAAIMMFHAGCVMGPGQKHLMSYEVRVPRDVGLPPRTKVDVVTGSSAHGTLAHFMTNRIDGDFIILSAETLIFTDRRRFIVINPAPAPAQVFELSIPRYPRPAPWTPWQRPIFLDTSESPWASVLYDVSRHTRSTNIPPDCMQVRYWLREWSYP